MDPLSVLSTYPPSPSASLTDEYRIGPLSCRVRTGLKPLVAVTPRPSRGTTNQWLGSATIERWHSFSRKCGIKCNIVKVLYSSVPLLSLPLLHFLTTAQNIWPHCILDALRTPVVISPDFALHYVNVMLSLPGRDRPEFQIFVHGRVVGIPTFDRHDRILFVCLQVEHRMYCRIGVHPRGSFLRLGNSHLAV